MNKVFLIGRLTAKPGIRYTPSNKPVSNFTVAVNRIGTDATDFVSCQVWNKQAENLVEYQDKGNLIAVSGSLRAEKYQNEQGDTKYITYVLVSNIEYLQNKKEESESVESPDLGLDLDGVQIEFNDDDFPFD